jgi:putative transposase
MTAVESLSPMVGLVLACAALAVSRASMHRRLRPVVSCARPRATSPRALNAEEKEGVLDVLRSERFVDRSPAEVVYTLLDEGEYLCSVRGMYRILAANAEVRERRDQLRHPAYLRPELLATAPGQVWSWDITALRGPAKANHFYLYVIMDIFSRKTVGWMLARKQNGALAERLIRETCVREDVDPAKLIVHSDRGTQMKGKTLAQLYADLDITASFSRPQVSNDNPFYAARSVMWRGPAPEQRDRSAVDSRAT